MAAEAPRGEDNAASSLDLLAVRLRRIEFLLSGSSDLDGIPNGMKKPASQEESVVRRLQALQVGLDKLRRNNAVAGEMIRDVEALCTHGLPD
jgi:hypothetical protein